MPYRSTATGGFTPGDTNMADFVDNVLVPFMTDAKASGGLGWISQVPSRGKGTSPNYEFLLSRGGVGTEAPPFLGLQTASKSLWIYTGNGINTAQESFDQPGNPMNAPPADPPGDPGTSANIGAYRCLMMNSLFGSYDGYWLFGGSTGEYCHLVLKINSRHYRHFHIGMLKPIDSTLDADSFYITAMKWPLLSPDNHRLGSFPPANNTNYEHKPYHREMYLPFRNMSEQNTAFAEDVRSQGMYVYSPNYGTLGYDWWFMTGTDVMSSNGGGVGTAYNTSGNPPNGNNGIGAKGIGDVNETANAITVGAGAVTGYDKSLGTVPFVMEPTFTTDGVALVPIYICLPTDFESALRKAPVATVPDVFRVNMKSLDPEQEISVGSDTYTVFPMINKDSANTLSGEGYSGWEGLAYKKITANAT